MKCAKIMVIIVIFVFAMSVSCAADTNNASISEDNSQMLLSLKNEITDDTSENSILAQTNNDETLSAQKNSEILRANEGTFSDLRKDIMYNGGKLTKSYYSYQQGDGGTILIDNGGFTVNGNGAVIDMKGSTNMRAFNVTGSGVTFKNLTIKNANFKGHGGAIYFSNDGTVTNCNFAGNTATSGDGGAVYFDYEGTVRNCNFSANTATKQGGAILLKSGTVSNCNFTDNQADSGGAILLKSGTVSNCNFTGNTATDDGGAIRMSSGAVSNCNFTGNTASGDGGAIRMDSGTVTNCNFTANKASDGGAVYFANTGNVTNCNFNDNNATRGGAIYMGSGTVSNCNFSANTATELGGAVRFWNQGNVTNCNFTDNQADLGGAILLKSGTVTNCNFTANKASDGGAVYFSSSGTGNVTNCNFSANTATGEGGAIFMSLGTVSNCNFSANTATRGGAVYFNGGNVLNCNFTGNNATTGSAIYFYSTSEQKSVSNSIFLNNRANAKDLQVTKNENYIAITFTGNNNLLNAIYSRNYDEVSFSDVTYWGANGIVNTDTHLPSISNNAAGQNITVSIVINDKIDSNEVYVTDENGKIVLNRNVGDNYFIGVCHDTDSYYTEILNSTSKNTKFSVNVNNQTSNNRRVNITAKSNIPNEVLKGKLLFILPNSTQINANYTSNGTWWAVHEFDDAGDYVINASYIGLDGVIINNATISIRYDASVDVNNRTLDLFVEDTFNLNATTNPKNLPVNFTSSNPSVVTVDKNGKVVALSEGNATIIVSVGGDGRYAENSTTVNVTVSKVPTSISIENETINLEVSDEMGTGATLNPTGAGNLTYNLSNEGIVKIEDGEIIALKEGNVTITLSFKGNNKYLAAENKTINVAVTLKDARVSVNNATLDLFVDNTFTIVANTTPKGLKVTYKPDNSGIISVDENGVVTALKEGNTTIIVSVGDNKVYAENITTVSVTVRKIPTEILITNETLDLKVNDKVDSGAGLNPSEAGKLTYTISETSIIKLLDNQIIALSEGSATITYSFAGNDKYAAAQNKTITVTVTLNDARVRVENDTLDLFVDDTFTIVANTTPKGLKVTYKPDNSGIISVDNNGVVKALKEGNTIIIVSVGDNKVYAENTTTVTVTVRKIPTEITVNPASLDLFVGDETVINANLTPLGAGNVTFTSSDDSIVTVDNQGNVIAEGKGQAIITVSFAGDNKYAAAENKTIKVTVSLNDARVTVDNDTLDLKVDETYKINATKHPDTIMLDITYKSSDESVASVDKNGIVTAISEGTAIITLEVGDDVIYAKNSTTVAVTVNKIPTDISIANATVNLNVDDEVSTNAKLNPEEAGNLTFTSSDESVAVVKDGKIIALKEGNAIITVSFKGNNKYAEAKNKTIKVTVKKLNPNMDITAEDITEGENATINVELPIDATGNVTTTVNGKTYSSPVDNGKAIITIPDLIKGDYTLPVTYSGDDKYNSLTKDVNLTVKEDEIVVSAPDLTKYYSGNERFNINVAYANGRAIAGKEVKVSINGVTYKRTTDENGSASLSINLNSATYDTVVEVDNITVNSLVTILPTIEAEDIESKSKNIVFTATFRDGEGNYLKEGTDVSFNIGGVIYNSKVTGDKGLATVDLVLNHGRYIITSYNSVSNENVSNSIAVDLKDARMILSGDEISVGENATIDVTLPDDATGNVTAAINGKTYTSQVDNGKANIIIPDLASGNYTAHVTYSGDNNYNHATGNVSISVSKVDAIIDVEDSVITVGENETVIVILPGDATGNVRIGNEIVPLKDGMASAVLTGLPVGINTIPVIYSGDDKYNPIETSADVVVNEKPAPEKKNLTIEASADEITEGEDAVIIVTGLENATGNVSAVVHGHVHSAPIVDGTARITVSGLAENATASVSYAGDDSYNPAVTHVNITVNKNVTAVISAENLTKYYKDSEKFTVKITDAKGQPAANKTVEITINGVTYKRTTDENGSASLSINLNSGVYPVRVVVDGVEANFTVTVQSTIDSSDIVKIFRNGTQYNAIFTDAKGTPLPNIKVSFNLHGIIYNRTTDKNGAAKLNINLDAGDYIITAFNSATGEKKSNTIKVISLIESDDLTKYYKNASQFVVRIHSADGGYVGAGEEVTFNINGVIYTRLTNATGHAKLNINLHQGNYTITTYYKDCGRGNTIEVLPILTAEDLSMKYMDGSQFKAQLVDGQGNPYPKQTVTFNINGVFYNRITDNDGVAKLNIRLMAGQYIITSSYGGCNIANKITVQS